jgi:hypothetical protein
MIDIQEEEDPVQIIKAEREVSWAVCLCTVLGTFHRYTYTYCLLSFPSLSVNPHETSPLWLISFEE